MQRILIFGGTSAIAEAVARIYAARTAKIALAGRDLERLRRIADDLIVRGASDVRVYGVDANDFERHREFFDEVWGAYGGIDIALVAHGSLPERRLCEQSSIEAIREFSTNASSVIALAVELALRLRSGATLAMISSVAGDRGRASNYLYGSAKAAVSQFASGLRQRLRKSGVNVLTIKPGLVDTPMTSAFHKTVLWAKPEWVAQGIVRAIDRRRAVVYLPWFWRWIMLAIRLIPEFVFKRIEI